ncbi:MAG TPA: hypothetical protein ENJ95_21485 [Bacteroidetes bacterium]|nr:hypothetical protein [Bacteroidota bacterium]
MKNLIEISKIVTKKKVRKIELFDNAALESTASKFNEFYEALSGGKFKNDRDAATLLYGCSPTHDKYRQLKSRFRKRLMNTLFFIDVNLPSASGYERAYFSVNKDWTLVKILISNDAHLTAQDMAKSILTTALKFRFADVIVNCCRILRQYAAEEGKEKEYAVYNDFLQEYTKVLDAEMHSEELFQKVLIEYRKPASELEGMIERMSGYCDELVSLSETNESPVVNYNMYLVWVYRYEMQRDYEAMLTVCQQAEKYIEDHPNYYQEDKLATFHLKKMTAYLHLRDFRNGRTNVERSLQTFPAGSKLWFGFLEYYLLLALHTDNYINAMAIFNRAISNSKFKKLNYQTREKWKIYETYLHYFMETQTDKIAVLRAQASRTFRPKRFLNDPVIYPKHLRVYTIHLVIAQFLFLLEKGNYQMATERVDRLKKYATKQLKKEDQSRMINFIRLLQQLAKANYKIRNMSGTDKYYERMVGKPLFYRGRIEELEIVPFEKLWDYILKQLG